MIPAKLRKGDEIRVISPARSLAMISTETREIANGNLARMGFKITFAGNVEESDAFVSSSIDARISDIHEAFADPDVKGILTTIGGFNSNQLLHYLDYDLIASNPKILCGYSDITALGNAIYARTGVVTYSGPHYSTFGMRKGLEFTTDAFQHCLMEDSPIRITPSEQWSDDPWFMDQENRVFEDSGGYYAINQGSCEGRLLGGNLCTLNLLQGTEYMPSLADSVLLIEDDSQSQPPDIDRDLQSLLHQPGFRGVRGVAIGRFQRDSNMTPELLEQIIRSKKELSSIPVVANLDIGHTTPHLTFPVGGSAQLVARDGQVEITITEH